MNICNQFLLHISVGGWRWYHQRSPLCEIPLADVCQTANQVNFLLSNWRRRQQCSFVIALKSSITKMMISNFSFWKILKLFLCSVTFTCLFTGRTVIPLTETMNIFLSPVIKTHKNKHVPFSLSRIMLSLLLLGTVLSICTFWFRNIQGGSNMTGTDLYVNKPHCAAAVRPWESEATTSTLPPARIRTCSVPSGCC